VIQVENITSASGGLNEQLHLKYIQVSYFILYQDYWY